MSLEEFLKKNNPQLPAKSLSLCLKALKIMRRSKDPLHNQDHVFRILGDLNTFLSKDPKINPDFEVLLLAICWHDTWRSKRFPKNLPLLFYHILLDGLGSMFLFAKETNGELEPQTTQKVKYAIRKHADFQLLKRQTLEAQILWDLDELDKWSLNKLKHLERFFLKIHKINPRLLRLAKFYFTHFMARDNESKFYFAWSKEEFKKRKEPYLKEVKKLLKDYRRYL